MPILDIEIVGQPDQLIRPTMAQLLADSAAAVFNAPARTTWVRLRVLPESDYAENGGADTDVRPVFVRVLKRDLPSTDALSSETEALTVAVAQATGRPSQNVHVTYEPAAAGRQAFGGRMVS